MLHSAEDTNSRLLSHAMIGTSTPNRLSIFAFLWACQALVHQDFYSGWLHENDLRGWAVTILAVGTLLRPSSLVMFSGLLLSSIFYNVAKWPFVVNHILLETIINATILAAVIRSQLRFRRTAVSSDQFRDSIIDQFAPVVVTMLVIMYWFAFLAKLNTDFLNPDVSCVVAMYADLMRRFPFLPDTPTAHLAAIYLTLIVEGAIPLLLSFRRMRWAAVLIGLPFHLVLGLIGHRTFSALAYVLYALMLIDIILPLVSICRQWGARHITAKMWRSGFSTVAGALVVGYAVLIVAELTGNLRSKVFGIGIYQVPWLIWITWSLVLGMSLAAAILRHSLRSAESQITETSVRPGLLWCTIPLVLLIGLSQYIGLKTETCFTMYSNLRTEGDWNNHLFMPAIKLGPWQNDLVKIVSTDHPKLQECVEHDDLITFFELRRIVSDTLSDCSFYLNYERAGNEQYLAWNDHQLIQTERWGKHPHVLGKLLYFRPVSADDCVPCRH